MSKVVEIQKENQCEDAILHTFSTLIPQMTEEEQEKLLAFGEGMVLMFGLLRNEKNVV